MKSTINSYKYSFSHLVNHGKKFPKIVVGNSRINHGGVFTKENLRKGRIVCPLVGIVYVRNEKNDNNFQHSFQISNDLAVEPVNEVKFINHSCKPNVFINKNWVFEAIRSIKKGEEIVIDYGWVDYDNYLFKCRCGNENCRKNLDGLISRNKKFQKENKKYFSPFLKSKFKLRS